MTASALLLLVLLAPPKEPAPPKSPPCPAGQTMMTGQCLAMEAGQTATLAARIDQWRQDCFAQSVMDSCVELAQAYNVGLLVGPNKKYALELFTFACQKMNGRGCLGAANNLGRKGPVALELLDRACRLYEAAGCAQAAALLDAADGVKSDPKRALELNLEGCQRALVRECAIAHRKGAARAMISLTTLCAAGNKIACSTAAQLRQPK